MDHLLHYNQSILQIYQCLIHLLYMLHCHLELYLHIVPAKRHHSGWFSLKEIYHDVQVADNAIYERQMVLYQNHQMTFVCKTKSTSSLKTLTLGATNCP